MSSEIKIPGRGMSKEDLLSGKEFISFYESWIGGYRFQKSSEDNIYDTLVKRRIDNTIEYIGDISNVNKKGFTLTYFMFNVRVSIRVLFMNCILRSNTN